MSYKSREKKRKMKLATASGQRTQRRDHASRHYLTIVTRSSACNECGCPLRGDAECVFRFEPKKTLCIECAERRQIYYRPSLRWERARS